MTTSYYHLTATEWDGGDLQCWNIREALGLVTDADWKWCDAPTGADGHLVSLASDLDEIETVADQGDIEAGTILRVDLPDGALTDHAELDWDDEDEDRVYLTTIREGETLTVAALARIPARYITRVTA